MMLTVYAVPISLYCAKLRIVLRHKQLDWEELAPPGGYGSDEYKAIVPAGNLPALRHDGALISDSEAIAEYLNEAFPEPDMLPGNALERAKIRELSRFHDTRLEPALRALFPMISEKGRQSGPFEKAWHQLETRLDQVTPLLPQSSGALTLADCGLAISGTWIEVLADHFDQPNPIHPRLAEYLHALQDHAAVSTELHDYRPKLTAWLANQ